MNIHHIFRPFQRYFRTKRMRQFWQRFGLTSESIVLDIGGCEFNWTLLPAQCHVTLINLSAPGKSYNSFTWIIGDGRHLPFKDEAFDVVYSNSVIEHLGSFGNQRFFADECRRVGQRYYVQTPNKCFFMEPHLITPFIHWLPRRIQRLLLRNFTLWGWITRPTSHYCESFMQEIRLLGEQELKHLFPEADIWHERFLGLSKSLMAVKNS
ncbi:MAG: hypothetical protein BWK74_07875 [Desulfobacteraceae bacterium A6]|nr:MAG: hypothetical protein BWK74_07875 [Desulfobacteraceae bacterium A6]